MSVASKLLAKLQNKKYRNAYLAENIRTGIAYQVRVLREEYNWSEERLANDIGKTGSFVSKIEDPSYARLSIQNLLDIAAAFDVALIIKFVAFSRFLEEYEDVSPEGLSAKSFEDDKSLQNVEATRGPIYAENLPLAVKRMIAGSDRQESNTGLNLALMGAFGQEKLSPLSSQWGRGIVSRGN